MTTILPVTADPNRGYQTERLWFVEDYGTLFAVMASTSDLAWAAVHYREWNWNKSFPSARINGLQEQIGVSTPRTWGNWMGLPRT